MSGHLVTKSFRVLLCFAAIYIPLACTPACQHQLKREPISSVLREPVIDRLIGGDGVENSI